jgi:hypothetical protein
MEFFFDCVFWSVLLVVVGSIVYLDIENASYRHLPVNNPPSGQLLEACARKVGTMKDTSEAVSLITICHMSIPPGVEVFSSASWVSTQGGTVCRRSRTLKS